MPNIFHPPSSEEWIGENSKGFPIEGGNYEKMYHSVK